MYAAKADGAKDVAVSSREWKERSRLTAGNPGVDVDEIGDERGRQ
jgi:hypothetical protein